MYPIPRNLPNLNRAAIDKLSRREIRVFELIGVGTGRQDMAEIIGVKVGTGDVFRARIKAKLNLRSARDLRWTAIRWINWKLVSHS